MSSQRVREDPINFITSGGVILMALPLVSSRSIFNTSEIKKRVAMAAQTTRLDTNYVNSATIDYLRTAVVIMST